jgi:hypothetical protein
MFKLRLKDNAFLNSKFKVQSSKWRVLSQRGWLEEDWCGVKAVFWFFWGLFGKMPARAGAFCRILNISSSYGGWRTFTEL